MSNNSVLDTACMSAAASRFARYLGQHGVDALHQEFTQSCHTVDEAAEAVGATAADLVKNICMIGDDGQMFVAIVRGNDRVSSKRVGKMTGAQGLRMATPDEILERTGYPVGGTPSFGFTATFIVDPKVVEIQTVYSGGGSPNALTRISSRLLIELNQASVARIRR